MRFSRCVPLLAGAALLVGCADQGPVLATCGVLALAACDEPQGPDIGTLRVSVATAGGDLDLDGYTVAVDSGDPQSVAINGTIVVPGLAAGPHDVSIGQVAGNCTVAGPNPSPVAVTRGDTAQVSFAVVCVATGIRITAATTGLDLDPDGYTVWLDGVPPVTLPPNGSVTISRLAAGAHQLWFGGMAANCAAAVPNPLSLGVPAGAVVDVGFPVTCGATSGIIEVTTSTMGVDLDADGYSIGVSWPSIEIFVSANDTVWIGGPGGDHTVGLHAVAPNCLVLGDNPRSVSITAGGLTRDTVRIAFAITCHPATGVGSTR